MLQNTNEKSSVEYWNKRVLEAKGDPQALVYASGPKLENCQRVGDTLIRQFVREGKTFLDVGCGYGRYHNTVKAMGGKYTGIDFSEEMIKEAQKRHSDGDFAVGNWQEYIGKFDIVFESICLSSSNYTFKQFREVLLNKFVKVGGILIMIEAEECAVAAKEFNLFDI